MAMHMQKTKRANEMSGVQNVQIGVPNIPNRETQVDFNDHYELVGATTSEKMELLIKILEECWDSAEKEAVAITTSLRELCRAD